MARAHCRSQAAEWPRRMDSSNRSWRPVMMTRAAMQGFTQLRCGEYAGIRLRPGLPAALGDQRAGTAASDALAPQLRVRPWRRSSAGRCSCMAGLHHLLHQLRCRRPTSTGGTSKTSSSCTCSSMRAFRPASASAPAAGGSWPP